LEGFWDAKGRESKANPTADGSDPGASGHPRPPVDSAKQKRFAPLSNQRQATSNR